MNSLIRAVYRTGGLVFSMFFAFLLFVNLWGLSYYGFRVPVFSTLLAISLLCAITCSYFAEREES